MMDPQTAYFFKKYYRNIIKSWYVAYNPEARRVWPSKAEEEEALRKESEEIASCEDSLLLEEDFEYDGDAFNETTGSYSGLYGKGPVDDDTQSMLDQIVNASNSQSSIDSLLQNTTNMNPVSNNTVELTPEQEEVIQEANIIYERLLREAKEDEYKRAAEIEEIKKSLESESEKKASSS